MINFEKYNVNTNGRTSGRMKTHCPQCHPNRRDKRDKSLSVNLDTGLAYCHYCEWKLNANGKAGSESREKYADAVPISQPVVLSDEVVQWFARERGISVSALITAGVTSAEEYMPQTGRKEHCICFNYYEGNRLVNTKFRTVDKHFKLISGAELIPYNLNSILDKPTCTIVEGEMDALALISIGQTEVISVPGGANRNLSWMDRFTQSHFDDKEVIYICVDTDRKGQELRDELIRRLGAERCRIVDLAPFKDANEVLLRENGAEALRTAIENAPEAPLEGVYTTEDLADEFRALYENGLGCGADTGWDNLDRLCTFEPGRLCVITGIPGSGKSEFTDELVLRLALRHHWRAAFFSPENMPTVYHFQKMAEKLIGTRFHKHSMTEVQYQAADRYLQQNIASILPKEDFTVDYILSRAQEMVRRWGIRQLVLDPLNSIDHLIPRGESETQYMNIFLNKVTQFARRNRCLVIILAHPRKMNREAGTQKTAVPDMYDVSGSAAFFNKCDFGLVVERDREEQVTRIHVEKVKFRHLGDKGTATFTYNRTNGRFAEEHTAFDNTNWIHSLTPTLSKGEGEAALSVR